MRITAQQLHEVLRTMDENELYYILRAVMDIARYRGWEEFDGVRL